MSMGLSQLGAAQRILADPIHVDVDVDDDDDAIAAEEENKDQTDEEESPTSLQNINIKEPIVELERSKAKQRCSHKTDHHDDPFLAVDSSGSSSLSHSSASRGKWNADEPSSSSSSHQSSYAAFLPSPIKMPHQASNYNGIYSPPQRLPAKKRHQSVASRALLALNNDNIEKENKSEELLNMRPHSGDDRQHSVGLTTTTTKMEEIDDEQDCRADGRRMATAEAKAQTARQRLLRSKSVGGAALKLLKPPLHSYSSSERLVSHAAAPSTTAATTAAAASSRRRIKGDLKVCSATAAKSTKKVSDKVWFFFFSSFLLFLYFFQTSVWIFQAKVEVKPKSDEDDLMALLGTISIYNYCM